MKKRKINKLKIKKAFEDILDAIGEDRQRPGIKDTPSRIAELYEEIFSGIAGDPKKELKTFSMEKHDELVLVRDIPVYSICEHHFLPFTGKAHVAYIPSNNLITGFGNISSLVDILSRRPQIQERLTTQIADTIEEKISPQGVIVVIEAEHMCMTMRKRKSSGAFVITSAVRGLFRKNEATRAEAMALIRK